MGLYQYKHKIESQPKAQLVTRLQQEGVIEFKSQYLLSALTLKQQALLVTVSLIALIGSYIFAYQTVIVGSIILIFGCYVCLCWSNRELSLITYCERSLIRFPESFLKQGINTTIDLSTIDIVYISQFYYHIRYYKDDDLFKSVYKLPVIVQAKIVLKCGSLIKVPLLNMTDLASFVTYLELNHITTQYRYPLSLSLIGWGALISFVTLIAYKFITI